MRQRLSCISHGSNVEQNTLAVLACNNVQIRYIHGALRSGYATIHNAQCNNSEDNLFELGFCNFAFQSFLFIITDYIAVFLPAQESA